MAVPPIVAEEHGFFTHNVTVDGVRLTVVDDGPREADETVLFLHGSPAWSFLYRRLIGPTIEAGHRVLAPDHAGCGRSEKPEDPAYYSLQRHIDNLEAVVDAREASGLTLVLHDWGGPIGMGLAARRPELVRRIVVANTTAFAPKKERALSLFHKTLSSRVGYQLGLGLGLVEALAMTFGVRSRLAPEARAAYKWPLQERGGRVAASRFVQMVPDGPEHPSARTLAAMEERYPKLRDKPMLVLWADKDPVFKPPLAERWQRDFPDADVRHVSQTAGHFWQEDDPEAFLGPILGFLRS